MPTTTSTTATASSALVVRHDLMSTDVPAARHFYTELFGWQPTDVGFMGTTIVRLSLADKVLGAIMPFDKRMGFPSHWVPYMSVPSVEDCCAKVKELRGDVCMGAMDFPPGRFALVNDKEKAIFSPFTPKAGMPAEPEPGPRAAAGDFCWDELHTTDVPSARTFYSALFNWGTVDWDMGPMGTYVVFQRGPQGVAGAMGHPPGLSERSAWLSYVAVDDVDAMVGRVKLLGGTVVYEPMDIPDVGRVATLTDPADARFAILQAPR